MKPSATKPNVRVVLKTVRSDKTVFKLDDQISSQLTGMHTHSDRNNSTPASGIVNCPIHPLLQKVVDLLLGHRNYSTDGLRPPLRCWKLSDRWSSTAFY